MSAEILDFTGITRLDLDPQRVLQGALEAGLAEVVIVGVDADGDEYFASSVSDGGTANWHLDRAKWNLMRQTDRLMEGDE